MRDEVKLVTSVKWVENQAEIQKAKQSGEKLSKAVEAGQKTKTNGFQNLTKDLDDLKKGIEAVGVSGDKFGKFAEAFAGGGKLAIIAAAGTAIVTTIKNIWDKLTVSVSEYLKLQDYVYKDAKEKTQSGLKQQNIDNGYLDSLQNLAELENLSNEQKKYALTLINLLSKQYGNLGIAIDDATGKITGLDEAQTKMFEKQSRRNLKNLQEEHESIKGLGNKRLEMALVSMNKIVGFDPIQQGLYDIFGYKTSNVEDAQQKIQSLSTADQISVLTEIRNKHVRTEEEIEAVQKVIELKKQQLEIEKQIETIKKSGVLTDDEIAKKAKNEMDRSRILKTKEKTSAEDQKGKQLDKQLQTSNDNFYYSRLDNDKDRLDYWNDKKFDEELKQKELTNQNQQLQNKKYGDEGRIEYDKRRIEYLKKVDPENQELLELQSKIYKYDEQRAKDSLKLKQNQNAIKESLLEQQKIEAEILKIKKRSADYYTTQQNEIQSELDVQKMYLQGKFREAEEQKILNNLKKQGLIVDQNEVKAILDKQEEFSKFKVDTELKKSAENISNQLKPQTISNVTAQRIKELEEANKVLLSDDQKSKIRKLVAIEFEMKNIKSVDSYESITNELTRRGGFSGGYYDNSDKIQRQIADNTRLSADLLRQSLEVERQFNKY